MPGQRAWVYPEAIAEERVEEAPRQWPPYLTDTRRYLLRRFPFFVAFRESEDRVQVLAVAHARRRPGYWPGRYEIHGQSVPTLHRTGCAGR